MGPARPFAVAAAVAVAVTAVSPTASADDDAARPVAVGVRLAQDADGAALTFDLSRPVDATAYTLASPDRILVDLPEVAFRIDPHAGGPDRADGAQPVRAFRFGLQAPGKSRIVVDLSRRACPCLGLAR